MRRYLLILLAIAGAIIAVGVLSIFRTPTLGLDLQGGLAIVLEAEAPPGEEIDREGMERSVGIMRNRIDRLGVTEPEIRRQGDNQIVIEFPGITDAGRAAEIVGTTAQLEFYKLQDNVTGPSRGPATNPVIPTQEDGLRQLLERAPEEGEEPEGEGAPTEWYLFSGRELLAGPGESREDVLGQLEADAPENAEFYVVPSGRIVLTCPEDARSCPGVGTPQQTYYYLFEYRPDDAEDPVPQITGDDLSLRGTQQDFDRGQPIVTLEFNDEGGDKFYEITRELAQEGRQVCAQIQCDIGSEDGRGPALQSFAIVLDREIRSFPTIDFVGDTATGIAGGRAQISGLEGTEEARDLALVLQTGALPYSFEQLERTDISATLGEDSLREALIAGIGGLIAVALFLLLVYRFLGVVAIVGLAVYGVFLYGTILALNVTMTLPSFAGIILTIGVAADANIVIFERIKEEVRAGKSVRAAIAGGYRKGFGTIVDANVVTMITAAVLFLVGTGSVRGFALMLLLGVLLSMVTAVLATRALLGTLGRFRWFDNPAFMGASAQKIPAWQRVDIVGRRRTWFTIAAVILALAVGSIIFKGLNLGIDFRGGSQVTFETPQAHAVATVREDLESLGIGEAVVQGRGEPSDGGYTSFQMKTEALVADEQRLVERTLETEYGVESVSVRNVSGSFSRQILEGAIIAIVISLVLIIIYVSFRFEYKFALPIFRALFYDVIVAMGVYSIVGWEVTAATVAAILTILGYSMYDTIIIFDRVRENMQLMKKSSFAAIANQSLWETIRRSLATSFITLLPITSLILFGGDTLKEFAFALLIGIGSGAFSTIFIATPFLATLKEREPEWERRKDAGLREKLEYSEPQREAEPKSEPAPEPEPVAVAAPVDGGDGADEDANGGRDQDAERSSAAARREARRKRRRARPHGRSR
jgi:SecD/SecF fusion protein